MEVTFTFASVKCSSTDEPLTMHALNDLGRATQSGCFQQDLLLCKCVQACYVFYVCLMRNKAAAKIHISRQGKQIQRHCELESWFSPRLNFKISGTFPCIGGSVVEFSPATLEARVRLPTNAEGIFLIPCQQQCSTAIFVPLTLVMFL